MKKKTRIFSIDEVNRLLPEIDGLLQNLLLKKEMYDRRHDEVFMHELLTIAESAKDRTEEMPHALEQDYLSLEEDLNDLEREIDKIAGYGCFVHDLETGCLDFPGKIEGEFVSYCWKIGETNVRYYHKQNSPAKDRIPL